MGLTSIDAVALAGRIDEVRAALGDLNVYANWLAPESDRRDPLFGLICVHLSQGFATLEIASEHARALVAAVEREGTS
jgi:hypothetical protein